jgi:prophage antirepressor-like protein
MTESIVSYTFPVTHEEIRAVLRDGEPWFVAKDVCGGLCLTDVSMALRNIPEKHKGTSKVCTPGGAQDMTLISEPGLYRLVMRSNKPEAQPFRLREFYGES